MLQLFLEPYRGPVAPSQFAVGAKVTKSSGTKGDSKGKYKLVSYCPECPPVHAGNPESNVRATVNGHSKQASCKNGHKWRVV